MTEDERSSLIEEMVELGHLDAVGDDLYEDMGGHVIHESNLDCHIEDFVKNLR